MPTQPTPEEEAQVNRMMTRYTTVLGKYEISPDESTRDALMDLIGEAQSTDEQRRMSMRFIQLSSESLTAALKYRDELVDRCTDLLGLSFPDEEVGAAIDTATGERVIHYRKVAFEVRLETIRSVMKDLEPSTVKSRQQKRREAREGPSIDGVPPPTP